MPMTSRSIQVPYLDVTNAPTAGDTAFFGAVVARWAEEASTLNETERLRSFLKYDPTPSEHISMHIMNWMVIAPTIATWVVGAPIVYLVRRAGGARESDGAERA